MINHYIEKKKKWRGKGDELKTGPGRKQNKNNMIL